MADTQLIERLTHCSQNTKNEYLHELTGRAATALTEAEAKLKTVLDREAETIWRYDAKLDAAEVKLAKARERFVELGEWEAEHVLSTDDNMDVVRAFARACLAELGEG